MPPLHRRRLSPSRANLARVTARLRRRLRLPYGRDLHSFLALSPVGLAIGGAVVLAGAVVRGYSGFGFSAILMTGLGLILKPAEIVPIAIALEVLASLGQAGQVWADIDWRRLWIILATGMAGNPVGVALLANLPADAMRAVVCVFTAAASAALIAAPRLNFPVGSAVLGCVGLLAGIVNGATALSGLVLALFLTLTGLAPARLRATFVAYFFLTDLWTGALLAGEGLFDLTAVRRVLASVPVLGIGLWLGGRVFVGTSPDTFRKLTLGVLIVLSLAELIPK